MSDTHDLKTWPEYFAAVFDSTKPFEVRKADRPFKVGDMLILREWNPETREYTGRTARRTISYRLDGGQFGVEYGYCVLGLEPLSRDRWENRPLRLPDEATGETTDPGPGQGSRAENGQGEEVEA